MIVQNCLKILNDISKIEDRIAILEKQVIVEDLDIDYQSLLNIIAKGITDK